MASHLTLEEREIVAHMHQAGKMQSQIVERLGRSKSTISRELRRNRSRNGYWAVAAQGRAQRRRSERPEWENRGRIRASVSIEGRPAVVDRRSRYGDWEGDTIVGANRRGGAVTLVERKSGYLLLGKVPDLQAATVRQAAAQRYQSTPAVLRKTLTLDNGKEFAEHQRLAIETELKIFFARPYRAWQRGTNENTNGLIRQFFPKGTDLASIPEHRFTKVQQLLNDRPRKRRGYRTPNEVLASRLKVAIDT